MQNFYIVGGQQKYLCPVFVDSNWSEYHKGIVVELDAEKEASAMVMDYSSPEDVSAESGAILFKAATLTDRNLYLCTETEILVYRFPEMVQTAYISLPIFNDLHHVTVTPWGTLVVANSGLEMVVELTHAGQILRRWSVLGSNATPDYSPDIDYRKVNLKPHKSHPNYVFFHGDEMWVTRFYQKDAISLTRPGRRMEIGVGSPHDGLVHRDHTYFTTVNGYVVIVNNRTLKADKIIDLNSIHKHGGPLGWARGIHVDGPYIWVGFSRIRPTKLKENLDWVKHTLKWRLRSLLPAHYKGKSRWMKDGPKNELPTRLVCYDVSKRKRIREINLEPHGISAVFSIIPAHPLAHTNTAVFENVTRVSAR